MMMSSPSYFYLLCTRDITGQTGTGKTYTMGILETVNDDHAGILLRVIQSNYISGTRLTVSYHSQGLFLAPCHISFNICTLRDKWNLLCPCLLYKFIVKTFMIFFRLP